MTTNAVRRKSSSRKRATKEDGRAAAYICACVSIVLFVIAIRIVTNSLPEADESITTGTVVSVVDKRLEKLGRGYYVSYRFVDHHGQKHFVEKLRTPYGQEPPQHSIGDRIRVAYKTTDPMRSRVSLPWARAQTAIIVLIFAVVFALFTGPLWPPMRKKKQENFST
jgi:Protein of unknown function (DUF3592)